MEVQRRSLFQDQIDKKEYINEMRFKPHFETWIVFQQEKDTYLGSVCQSVTVFYQMRFTFGDHSILSEWHETMTTFLEKRAHTPTHRIAHAILNCTP